MIVIVVVVVVIVVMTMAIIVVIIVPVIITMVVVMPMVITVVVIVSVVVAMVVIVPMVVVIVVVVSVATDTFHEQRHCRLLVCRRTRATVVRIIIVVTDTAGETSRRNRSRRGQQVTARRRSLVCHCYLSTCFCALLLIKGFVLLMAAIARFAVHNTEGPREEGMADETHRAALAERAARAGGVVARGMFRDGLDAETKTDKNDLVSSADRDAQLQVIATIQQEFPAATLVCEEDVEPVDAGEDLELVDEVPETGDAWVVDPIDGTGNFLRGIGYWATCVAAVTDGEPIAAATYLPVMEDLYSAGPESVTLNDSSMRVSEREDPETFAVGLNGWWPVHGRSEWASLFEGVITRFGDARRFGSMQSVLALVAAGSLDAAFMPTRPHPWDSLAGAHLIRRAGGVATDIHGDPWQVDSEGLIVSNGLAHDAVVDVVQRGLGIEV